MALREVTAELAFEQLRNALSESQETFEAATERILGLEKKSGFFASLIEVAAASDGADPNVRWLAVVCLKNAVPRTWEGRGGTVIDEERDFVRKALIGLIGERDEKVATQVAVAIARIARLNCPVQWPELIPTLMELIANQSSTEALRVGTHALQILYLVLKEFAARRLMRDRRMYESMAPDLLRGLYSVWTTSIEMLAGGSPDWQTALERAKLSMKCFRQVLDHGMTNIEHNEEVTLFFQRILELPQLFFRSVEGQSGEEMTLSKLAAKCVINAQNRHPKGFYRFLAPFLERYTAMLTSYEPNKSSERVEALACTFVRNVVQCPAYKRPVGTMNGGSLAPEAEAGEVLETFFTESRSAALIKELIVRVFVLTDAELQSWDDDPEGLIREEEAADWNSDKLRSIAESLYGSLLSKHRSSLVRMVLEFTENVPDYEPLTRDACYRAIGRGCYDFKDTINFTSWFEAQLAPQLRQKPTKEDMRARVAKARAAWLVKQFVSQIPRSARVAVYTHLVPLLRDTEDLVIALTAMRALHALVDDLDFDGVVFAHFLVDALSGTFALVEMTSETETLTNLLQFAALLVEKSPPDTVLPHVSTLAQALMTLWDGGNAAARDADAGSQNLIRGSIVLLLKQLIESVGAQGLQDPNLAALVYPVISFGTTLEGEGSVYLVEDVLDLWIVVLRNLETYTEEVSKLFPNIVALIERDFDNLKPALDILSACVVIGGIDFMRTHSSEVARFFQVIIGNVRDRGAVASAVVMELILKIFPVEGSGLFLPCFQKMLQLSMAESESVIVTTEYENLFARVAVQAYDVFVQLVEGSNVSGASPHDKLIFIVRDMLDKADMHWDIRRKKLTALALLNIMSRNPEDHVLLKELPLVLNVLVQVLADLDDSDRRGQDRSGAHSGMNSGRNLVTFADVPENDEEHYVGSAQVEPRPSLYHQRRRVINDSDFVLTIDFRQACSQVLDQIRLANPEGFNHAIGISAPSLLEQLSQQIVPSH
mmetsp:Transcript_2808/g.8559  ORF Transcript_2808/g.8559 Transcript_2808/m.8559 type:complete len:998 (+) Transcript_2808:231-3224(+)